jgi:hypothetical protein
VTTADDVRSGGDTRQLNQTLMCCGWMMYSGGCSGLAVVEECRALAECRVLFVRGSPCDVRANAGAADRAQGTGHDSKT